MRRSHTINTIYRVVGMTIGLWRILRTMIGTTMDNSAAASMRVSRQHTQRASSNYLAIQYKFTGCLFPIVTRHRVEMQSGLLSSILSACFSRDVLTIPLSPRHFSDPPTHRRRFLLTCISGSSRVSVFYRSSIRCTTFRMVNVILQAYASAVCLCP